LIKGAAGSDDDEPKVRRVAAIIPGLNHRPELLRVIRSQPKYVCCATARPFIRNKNKRRQLRRRI